MDLQEIMRHMRDKKVHPLGIKRSYSVLIPLVYIDQALHLLYEIRSYDMATQPGEISFPGGKVEPQETYKEAAIRETWEELLIDRERIKIIGALDYIASPYNFNIYPYVGILDGIDPVQINYNQDEVDSLFTVPLEFLIKNPPNAYEIKLETITADDFPYHLIPNGKDYRWKSGTYPVYFYQYKDKVIWGMTARMTKNFIDAIHGEIDVL